MTEEEQIDQIILSITEEFTRKRISLKIGIAALSRLVLASLLPGTKENFEKFLDLMREEFDVSNEYLYKKSKSDSTTPKQ